MSLMEDTAEKVPTEGTEMAAEKEIGLTKSDEEFAQVGTALLRRKFERRPAIVPLEPGHLFKETLSVQLKVAGDVPQLYLPPEMPKKFSSLTLDTMPDEIPSQPKIEGLKLSEASQIFDVHPTPQLSTIKETISRPETANKNSVSFRESSTTTSHLTASGLTSLTGIETGTTELSEIISAAPSSGGTGPMEEAFLTNEDLSEEDRTKAIAWAAGAQGVEHVGFLPECVLKMGFKIKKFKLWMPVELCVDYQHKRMTLMCPDSVTDILLRKMMAHRIEAGDIRVETPVSHKYKPGQASPPGTSVDSVPHFSKRRLNMVRNDNGTKYRLIAPTTEYRDRLLDVLFMMSGPAKTSSKAPSYFD